MSQAELDILPFCEAFYIESMFFTTDSALRSVALGNDLLKKLMVEREAVDENQILNHLQNVIVQGAALSRYFWPVRQGHEKRGEILRKAFTVADSSPLKSRDLRNEIEHFDEKLDAYLSGGIVGVILPSYIGPLIEPGGVPTHLFRAYFTDKAVFQVLGKRFEINPITREIGRIHKLLDEARSHGGRFPGDKVSK